MSKNLYLVRHAQAHSLGGGQKDFDRELTSSGFSDASRLGKKLFDRGIKADKIISSSAPRAAITAELISEQLKFPLVDIIFDKEVFEASVRSLLALVNQVENEWHTLIIVGHNPVISYFAEYITGEQIGSLQKCGVIAIEFDPNTWVEVGANSGKVKFIEQPRTEDPE